MAVIADAKQVSDLIDRLAGEIASAMDASRPWALVGIRRRGDVLAQRLAKRLKPDHHGTVDITLYRDDLSEVGPQPTVRTSEIDFDIDAMNIVLVDDVLMSGRSVRAAIQSLIDYGRPKCIKLAVLVDRGGRELPICPDFTALKIDAGQSQHIRVRLTPTDPEDKVMLIPKPASV